MPKQLAGSLPYPVAVSIAAQGVLLALLGRDSRGSDGLRLGLGDTAGWSGGWGTTAATPRALRDACMRPLGVDAKPEGPGVVLPPPSMVCWVEPLRLLLNSREHSGEHSGSAGSSTRAKWGWGCSCVCMVCWVLGTAQSHHASLMRCEKQQAQHSRTGLNQHPTHPAA